MTKLRLAIVGAGPAGIYAADILLKHDRPFDVSIDLFEQLPAPYGLVRYGVAPDHPRIKGIVKSLHNVLDRPRLRLLGNIEVGRDITVEELREHYDAVVFATGAVRDRALDIPGVEAEGSFGAADFVGFYDGNPDFSRDWDLSAEKVGVIGVGNVGKVVVRRASGFGMRMLGTDPITPPDEFLATYPLTMVSLEELLRESDFISVNCDLNPTSFHLLNDDTFARMKPGTVVVNTARGPIIDEAALVRALQSGHLGGAGLDVFEHEPLPADSPLRQMDNVMLAPHNSNSSPEAWERVHLNTIRNLLDVLEASES